MSTAKAEKAPTESELRRLYEAAVRYRDLAPWAWMSDSDLFGVENPESGQIGYCCVLGNAGEQFGLNVYLGSEGLDGYWSTVEMGMSGELEAMDAIEMLTTQRLLEVSFDDREALSPQDLAAIKSLGLKFRGRAQWPMFRSYVPGFAPWLLTGAEARFLATALEQAMIVASAFREDPDLLPEVMPGTEVLVRCVRPGGTSPTWENLLIQPAPPAPEPLPEEPSPEEMKRAKRLQKLPVAAMVIEVGTILRSEPVQEKPNDRPFFPLLGILLDTAQGLALGMTLTRIDEASVALRAKVLEAIEQAGSRPAALITNDERVRWALDPVATEMQIPLYEAEQLFVMEDFLEQMEAYGL